MPEPIERPKFLTELFAEVDAFDEELFKPIHPVSADTEDKVVGTLSPWLRKLFALSRYYDRQMKLTVVEREYDSVDTAAQDTELCVMKYKHSVLLEIMWPAIRSELNLWNANSVGVRMDWQVVTSKPESEDEDFQKFLAFLMGRKKKG